MSDLKREVIKISILGNQAVGKTSIRSVYLGMGFINDTLATVGYNKVETKFKLNSGKEIKIVIWDTAGQERFHSMALNSLKNSQGLILVYDVTNRQSFIDLQNWLKDVKNATDKVSIILFGNKCELENRAVTKEEAEQFAKKNNIPYIETSAKLKINIDEGVSKVVNDAYIKYGEASGLALKRKKKKKKSCC